MENIALVLIKYTKLQIIALQLVIFIIANDKHV